MGLGGADVEWEVRCFGLRGADIVRELRAREEGARVLRFRIHWTLYQQWAARAEHAAAAGAAPAPAPDVGR